MFEIFFFINPIGIYCYDIEKTVQQTIKQLTLDACYHYIPLSNIEMVRKDMMRRQQDCQKTCNLSTGILAAQRALQFYHAIKIAAGNKKARRFLFNLQRALNDDETLFSNGLACQLVSQLGINYQMIFALLSSKYVQESIAQDQKIVKQWRIKQTPTTVIFNEVQVHQSGILLEGPIKQQRLIDLLTNQISLHPYQNSVGEFFPNHYLRLI